jgi:hypothetical protein
VSVLLERNSNLPDDNITTIYHRDRLELAKLRSLVKRYRINEHDIDLPDKEARNIYPSKEHPSIQQGPRRCHLKLQPSCAVRSIIRDAVQPRRTSYLRPWFEESLAAGAVLSASANLAAWVPDYPIICRATASAIGDGVFE